MLTLFLRVLPPGVLMAGRPFGCGRADVGAGVGGPRFIDGARRPLPLRGVLGAVEVPNEGFGKLGSAGRAVLGGEMLPVLLRVLETGKAGRAMFGGPLDGLEGRGRAVDMAGCVRVESWTTG